MAKETKPSEPSASDKLLADLMLDRQARAERAAKAIEEICKKERVAVKVSGLEFTEDGRVVPQVKIVALIEQ